MDRENLNFASQVFLTFDFLQERGFLRFEESPTIVRYRKGDLQLNIFHGCRSYEIGLEVGKGNSLFSLREIIRISDKQAADGYFRWAARTPESVTKGIVQLAELLRKYGQRALDDDQVFFTDLESQRKIWQEAYILDVRAQQIRPLAEAAFKRGDFRQAVSLYDQIYSKLGPAEVKKLEIAKKRTK